MPYVGNPLADAFSSRQKQDLTGQSGTSFTLSHAVSSPNDLSVYINHVRQEPTTAYTVNGTTLTTTGSVAGTDDFYIIYDELALQSISHPTNQALTATSGTFTSGLVGTTATFSGALSATTGTFSGAVDIQGQELILDADNDTSIKSDTDDQIDFKAGNIIRASVISTGLQVGGTAYFASPTLTLKDPDSGVGAGTVGGKIDFHTMDSTATGVSARINAVYEDTSGNTALAFSTGSGGSISERMRINSTGNLAFAANKGIDFANASAPTGGNPAETSTATVLDDYEEGTFTPYSNSVTGGSPTAVGMYVKVGNIVNMSIRFSASGCSTNGHQFGIYLPFSAASTESSGSYNTWICPLWFSSAPNSNGLNRVGTMEGNNNYVNCRQQGTSSSSEITGNSMGGSFGLHFSITYRTKD